MVSATGFEPVNLACKPLKTLDLYLGTELKISSSLIINC